jgi:acetyl esterase/lipase
MVLIHGGAWSTGDKDEFGLLDETAFSLLKSQFPDFAFFNLNYRLVEGDNNTYPAAENDIKLAMEHIYRNLESYQLSAATYVLGVSAGAHLGALYTLKSNNSNIKGCIALAGPYDLVSLYNTSDDFAKSYIKSFMGGTPTQKPALYQEASPINFVSSNSPKFFLVHGTEDELVPIAQAETFKAALESKNVSTTYLTYAGGHDYVPTGSLLETFLRLQIFLK